MLIYRREGGGWRVEGGDKMEFLHTESLQCDQHKLLTLQQEWTDEKTLRYTSEVKWFVSTFQLMAIRKVLADVVQDDQWKFPQFTLPCLIFYLFNFFWSFSSRKDRQRAKDPYKE